MFPISINNAIISVLDDDEEWSRTESRLSKLSQVVMVSRDSAFIIIVIIYFQAKSVLEKNRKDGSIICSLASDCQYAQRPTKSFRDLEVSLCIAIKCISNPMIIFSVDFSWPAADHMMIKCHRIEKPCKSPQCFQPVSQV